MSQYIVSGGVLWTIILFVLFQIRPKAALHQMNVDLSNKKNRVATLVVLVATILVCTIPMGWNPIWNGEQPDHRNQYEIMAKSMLNGHLYMDYEVDPLLLEMENPYNLEARKELGVNYHWDHAFYDGHYYMYFGVVPVFLLFLPYLIITGTSLTTYHATQVFVTLFICGIFATFYLLTKRFFEKMSMAVYLTLSAAFSMMSVWYSVGTPALYCTAITSALCMEIWSLYFFARAVWVENEQKKTIVCAFFGSLFGALAFGCRPPIALANLFVIPLLMEYLRKRKINWKLIRQLAVAASPYLVVAVLLMLYNYVRFDSPFEFGQAYQLTAADQSGYTDFFQRLHWHTILNGIIYNFFSCKLLSDIFPYVVYNGFFVNFPILLFSIAGFASEGVRKAIKEKRLGFFVIMLFLIPVVITVFDTMWSPFLMERYRMDMYWILGVLCFTVIGLYYMQLPENSRRSFSCFIAAFGLITVGMSILLFFVQDDSNLAMYYPQIIEEVKKIITLGLID